MQIFMEKLFVFAILTVNKNNTGEKMWEKIKMAFSPFFILFYVFLGLAWYFRDMILAFLNKVFY